MLGSWAGAAARPRRAPARAHRGLGGRSAAGGAVAVRRGRPRRVRRRVRGRRPGDRRLPDRRGARRPAAGDARAAAAHEHRRSHLRRPRGRPDRRVRRRARPRAARALGHVRRGPRPPPDRFRYHGLFAELLRVRLRLEQPGLEPELHARAAQWLAANGLGREAIPHALRRRATLRRSSLAGHWLELLLDGSRPKAVSRPPAAPHRRAARVSRRLRVARARRPRRRGGGLAGARGSTARPAGSRSCCAPAPAATSPLARAAGALLATPAGARGDERGRSRSPLGAREFAHGRLEAAAERLEGAAAIAVESGRERAAPRVPGRGAALEVAEGRLRRAEPSRATASRSPSGGAGTGPPRRAWAYLTLAAVNWQATSSTTPSGAPTGGRRRVRGARGAAVVAIARVAGPLAAARGDRPRPRPAAAVHEALPTAGPFVERWLEALGPAPWASTAPRGGRRGDRLATRGDPLAALRRSRACRTPIPTLHPVLRLHAWLIAALAHHGLGQLDSRRPLARAGARARLQRGLSATVRRAAALRRLLARHLARPTAYGPLVAELLDALAREARPRRTAGTAERA